jgi:hypothetical protein
VAGLTLPDIIALETAQILRDRDTCVEIWTADAVADHPWLKALLAEINRWQQAAGKAIFVIELPGQRAAVVFHWNPTLRVDQLKECVCLVGGFLKYGASLEFQAAKLSGGTLKDHGVTPGARLSLYTAPAPKAEPAAARAGALKSP